MLVRIKQYLLYNTNNFFLRILSDLFTPVETIGFFNTFASDQNDVLR